MSHYARSWALKEATLLGVFLFFFFCVRGVFGYVLKKKRNFKNKKNMFEVDMAVVGVWFFNVA